MTNPVKTSPTDIFGAEGGRQMLCYAKIKNKCATKALNVCDGFNF